VLINGSKDITHQDVNEPREAQASDVPAGCSGKLTPSLEEGPFYKTGSPERTKIAERSTIGSKLVVEGYVFDRNCRPIANAWLDRGRMTMLAIIFGDINIQMKTDVITSKRSGR
jgi:hypothetical protein